MLVLVDGRSVYTPLYGGVYWDALDLPLEDIERVEIIRGPGGALWGANAVNGVINIVTKSSQHTQGAMVSTSADLDQGYTSTVQYGGCAGRSVSYRVFGKSSYWEPFNSPSGAELPSNFNLSQVGAQTDWAASGQDQVSFQAGTYEGAFRNTETFLTTRTTDLLKGNNLLLNWKRELSVRSRTELLTYCDWYTREGTAGEMRNICEAEFQHSYEFAPRHSLIWGGSFLSTGDHVLPDSVPVVPQRQRTNTVSSFAQYDFVAVPDRLRVISGIKLDHNGYSGFEYQPQLRAVWTPNKSHTVWGSFARAVRTPSRIENGLDLLAPGGTSNGLPVFFEVRGNADLQSERLKAYELGYRYEPNPALSFDLALYYNDYSNLISGVAGPPEILPTMILIKSPYLNRGTSQTHGAELSVKWKPVRRWTLSPAVTELRGNPSAAEANPRHLFNLQSRLDLPHKLEFDSGLYHYGALPLQANLLASLPPQGVSAFNRLDAGLAWHATSQWTFAVWGRNLQADKHVESLPSVLAGAGAEVPRSVSFKITWQARPERSRSN